MGQLVYVETDTPAVVIAGGIGISPFRAILGDLAARKLHARCTLPYSSASADIPFRTYFDSLMTEWPELRVAYTVTRPSPAWRGPTGRIDSDFVTDYMPDVARPLFFMCGPMGLGCGAGHTGQDWRWVESNTRRFPATIRFGD